MTITPMSPALAAGSAAELGAPVLPLRDGSLQNAMESAGAAFAVVDAGLRIYDHNPALVEQYGDSSVSLIGRNICQLMHPSVEEVLLRQFQRLMERRTSSFVEHMPALWATRSKLSGTVTGTANHGPDGRVESVLLMVSSEESPAERRTLISPTRLLSKIHAQILEGVAAGAPTVQLAGRLFLSRQGVEYHVSNMLKQFKVPNRAALVSKSYSMGLFKVGSWPPRVLPDYVRV